MLLNRAPMLWTSSAPRLQGLAFKSFAEPVFGSDGRFALLATIRGTGVKAATNEGLWTGTFGGSSSHRDGGWRGSWDERREVQEDRVVRHRRQRRGVLRGDPAARYGGDEEQTIAGSGSGRSTNLTNLRSCVWRCAKAPRSPGPALLLHSKVVKFETLSVVRGSEGEGRASASYDRIAVLATLENAMQVIGTVDNAGEWHPEVATSVDHTGALSGLQLASLGMPDISSRESTLACTGSGYRTATRRLSTAAQGVIAEQGAAAPGVDGAVFAGFSSPVADATGPEPRIAFVGALRKGNCREGGR